MRRTSGIAVLTTLALLALAGLTFAAATKPVKLPKKLTSPSGNFFTLYAFDQPTSGDPVASALMQVCASNHTPKDTYIDPALFKLKLSSGASVPVAKHAAHSPALVLQHLNRLQCSTKGWMSFDVPKGAHAVSLEYDYNGQISWAVG